MIDDINFASSFEMFASDQFWCENHTEWRIVETTPLMIGDITLSSYRRCLHGAWWGGNSVWQNPGATLEEAAAVNLMFQKYFLERCGILSPIMLWSVIQSISFSFCLSFSFIIIYFGYDSSHCILMPTLIIFILKILPSLSSSVSSFNFLFFLCF